MWLYKNKKIQNIEDFPKDCFGFIYIITNLENNKKYIGKKNLYTKQNKKLGKKELNKLKIERKKKGMRGKTPTKKLIIKESNWLDYKGSNTSGNLDELHNLPQNKIKKEILEFAFNSKQLTYLEIKYQVQYQILENPKKFYNKNISGKFFSKDILNN